MIAEQIYKATQMQQQSFDTLSQNLAMLGQSVTNSLKQQADQRQFQQALPMLQSAYKNAMNKMASDDVSGGFSDLLSIQAAFGGINNPQIQNLNNNLLQLGMMAGQYRDKYNQRQAQYGGGGLPATRIPTTEEIIAGGFSGDDYVSTASADQEAQAIDQEAVDGLQAFGQEQGFEMGLAPEGRVDFGMSKFIPPQRIRDRVFKDVDAYRNRTPEGKIDYLSQVAETDVAPPDEGEMMDILGLGRGIVVPPSVAPEPTGKKVTKETSGWTQKGGFKKDVTTEPITKTPEQLKAEAEELSTFKAMVSNYNVARRMIETNPQLKDIFAKAGGDITRIGIDPIDEETVNATIDGQPVGNLAVAAPQGMMSEAMALNTIISAPGMFGKEKGKYRFYPEEKTTEAPAPRKERFPVKDAAPAATEQPTPEAEPTPRFSAENPYAAQVEAPVETTRKPTRGGSSEASVREAKNKLEEINNKIKNIDDLTLSMGRGRTRKATTTEKAKLWEELNNEKKRLEKILSSQ